MTPTKIAVEYVLKGSSVCRWHRKDVDWMVREGMIYLPDPPDESKTEEVKAKIRGYLKGKVRERHAGNPILIFILLNIVLPIVIRLLIEWWLSKRGNDG